MWSWAAFRESAQKGKGEIPGNQADTLFRLGWDSNKMLMVNGVFLCIWHTQKSAVRYALAARCEV